jgi:hypothetical protein
LPLNVQIPGLLLLAYLAYRTIRAAIALKPVRAITSILMFVLVAVFLSRFGNALAIMIGRLSSQQY